MLNLFSDSGVGAAALEPAHEAERHRRPSRRAQLPAWLVRQPQGRRRRHGGLVLAGTAAAAAVADAAPTAQQLHCVANAHSEFPRPIKRDKVVLIYLNTRLYKMYRANFRPFVDM